MENGKLANDLNLALTVPENIRKETYDLGVGYDEKSKTWELIIKYTGNLKRIAEELSAQITILSNQYAIITIQEDKIRQLADYEEIAFIEKPRRLFFEVINGMRSSCMMTPELVSQNLTGKGVLVGIIDSGIDYRHLDFRKQDGTTRILNLWDQSAVSKREVMIGEEIVELRPPAGYYQGIEYNEDIINQALKAERISEQMEIVAEIDISGHGTHVAGIACGNGRAGGGRYRGVAPESSMIVVKLGSSVGNSFPRTTRLMEAINYVMQKAIEYQMPVVINLSFGNSYGAHNGKSLLENFINDVSDMWKSSIVIGTGNEGGSGHHTGGEFAKIGDIWKESIIELVVSPNERSLNIQLWKNYYDDFDIELISPGGNSTGIIRKVPGTSEYTAEHTRILLYYGEPIPNNRLQEIYMEFLHSEQVIPSGIWRIRFIPRTIITGNYDIWLPAGNLLQPATRFLRPVEETTLTIPSTAYRAITVGAYDAYSDSYAYFSGRGYTRGNQEIKPDLVAPGVNITSAAPGGGYTSKTGTSMATPFVSGAAALMMEWGLIRGNDPYLYGEKIKAYLIKGARELRVFEHYPNPWIGYGALCLADSLPE